MDTVDFSITIKGIPKRLFQNIIKYATKTAKEDFGLAISHSDKIEVDYEALESGESEAFDDLMASALAANAVHQIETYRIRIQNT